jgi:hypothetical protein
VRAGCGSTHGRSPSVGAHGKRYEPSEESAAHSKRWMRLEASWIQHRHSTVEFRVCKQESLDQTDGRGGRADLPRPTPRRKTGFPRRVLGPCSVIYLWRSRGDVRKTSTWRDCADEGPFKGANMLNFFRGMSIHPRKPFLRGVLASVRLTAEWLGSPIESGKLLQNRVLLRWRSTILSSTTHEHYRLTMH